jgi:hypothetical protein
MAPRKDLISGDRQGSIEIAYVKLNGNDATLQEAVRAFSTLLNRPASSMNTLPTPKRVNVLPAFSAFQWRRVGCSD